MAAYRKRLHEPCQRSEDGEAPPPFVSKAGALPADWDLAGPDRSVGTSVAHLKPVPSVPMHLGRISALSMVGPASTPGVSGFGLTR